MPRTKKRVLGRFSCKVEVVRPGQSLFGRGYSQSLAEISIESSYGSFTFSIISMMRTARICCSCPDYLSFNQTNVVNCKHSNINRTLWLEIDHYDSSDPAIAMCRESPGVTKVIISEAPLAAIELILKCIYDVTGLADDIEPRKRQASSELEILARKRSKAITDSVYSLGPDILSIIIAMVGSLGVFRLLNSRYNEYVCNKVEKLKICSPKIVSNAMLSRLLQRTERLKKLDLDGCSLVSIVQDAATYPLSRLKSLSLKDCSHLNTMSVISVLELTPNLTQLNLLGCSRLDDSLLLELSLRLTLKELKKVSFRGFSSSALSIFFTKYLRLKEVWVENVKLTTDVFQALEGLPMLEELTIQYTERSEIKSMTPWSRKPLRLITILPYDRFPCDCLKLMEIWRALKLQEPEELGCAVDMSDLSPAMLRKVTKLTSISLPREPLPALRKLVLFTYGQDLKEHLKKGPSSVLGKLEQLQIKLSYDSSERARIADLLILQLPNCPAQISLTE